MYSYNNDPSVAISVFLIHLFFIGLFLWPWAIIHQKVGFSGWRCFILLIPGINVVYMFYFAFASWPVFDRLIRYRKGDFDPVENPYL